MIYITNGYKHKQLQEQQKQTIQQLLASMTFLLFIIYERNTHHPPALHIAYKLPLVFLLFSNAL